MSRLLDYWVAYKASLAEDVYTPTHLIEYEDDFLWKIEELRLGNSSALSPQTQNLDPVTVGNIFTFISRIACREAKPYTNKL